MGRSDRSRQFSLVASLSLPSNTCYSHFSSIDTILSHFPHTHTHTHTHTQILELLKQGGLIDDIDAVLRTCTKDALEELQKKAETYKEQLAKQQDKEEEPDDEDDEEPEDDEDEPEEQLLEESPA